MVSNYFKISNQYMSIYNVYGPNCENKAFFLSQLQSESIVHKIVGGDLNMVLNWAEDRRGPLDRSQVMKRKTTPYKILSNLLDSWRTL